MDNLGSKTAETAIDVSEKGAALQAASEGRFDALPIYDRKSSAHRDGTFARCNLRSLSSRLLGPTIMSTTIAISWTRWACRRRHQDARRRSQASLHR